jgi:hypothetical protein
LHRGQKDNASIESKSGNAAEKSTTVQAEKVQQSAAKSTDGSNASLENGHAQRGAYRGRGATRGRGRGRGGFSQPATGAPYMNGRPKTGYVNVDAETLKAFLLQQL